MAADCTSRFAQRCNVVDTAGHRRGPPTGYWSRLVPGCWTCTSAGRGGPQSSVGRRRRGPALAEKRKAVVPTFREAAGRVFEANRPRWRNGKHTATWRQSLEHHVFPAIGSIPVNRISRVDVLGVLTPILTARRVRQRTRAVLKWAMAGYVESNAAGGR